MEPLLTGYSLALAGLEFATWFFAFETRKTFKGGIFWNAWRFIAPSLLFLMANQLILTYEAVNGSTDMIDAVAESFEAMGTILIFVGFYLFYKAWNPRGIVKES